MRIIVTSIIALVVSQILLGQTMPNALCGNRNLLGVTIGDAMSFYPSINYVDSKDGKRTYSYESGDVIGFISYKDSDKYIYNQTVYYTDVTYEHAKSLFSIVRNEINTWGSFDYEKMVEKDRYFVDFDGYRNLVLTIIPSDVKGKHHLVIDLTDSDILFSTVYQKQPKNNLRKPFSELRKSFPDLKFNGSSREYQVYLDGDMSEGIFSKFYIKNNRVLKEQLFVRSTNGFARDWFNSTSKSFEEKGGWVTSYFGANKREYRYGNFKLVISYNSTSSYYETVVEYEALIRDY